MLSPQCDELISSLEVRAAVGSWGHWATHRASRAAHVVAAAQTRPYLVLGMRHPQVVVRRLTATVMRKRFCGPGNEARFAVVRAPHPQPSHTRTRTHVHAHAACRAYCADSHGTCERTRLGCCSATAPALLRRAAQLCDESVFEVAVPLLGDKEEHVALQVSDVIVQVCVCARGVPVHLATSTRRLLRCHGGVWWLRWGGHDADTRSSRHCLSRMPVCLRLWLRARAWCRPPSTATLPSCPSCCTASRPSPTRGAARVTGCPRCRHRCRCGRLTSGRVYEPASCARVSPARRVESITRARIMAVTSGIAAQSCTALSLCVSSGLLDVVRGGHLMRWGAVSGGEAGLPCAAAI